MMKYAGPRFPSRIDVKSTVLHPWIVNGAKNLTEHCEVSYRISSEPHVITLSRGDHDSAVKKMYYGETVSLSRIVIYYVDDNVLAQRDIHYRPRKRMISTSIEAYIESFVCHYDRKYRSISRTAWSDPTVWRARPEKMERISCGEKTRNNYDDG
jgi:hypothetical protein